MKSVEDILKRNHKVEMDKAWETSKTRRFIIALITYLTACAFLKLIQNEAPFINALVPVGGYLISTFSLPFIKDWWIANLKNAKDVGENNQTN